jgi:hypothetical protein
VTLYHFTGLDIDTAIPWEHFARGALNMSKANLLAFNLAGGSDGSHWFIARVPIGRDRIKAFALKGEP